MHPKNKIVFYGLWPELHDYVRSKLPALSVVLHSESLTLQNVDPATTIVAVFIESPVTQATIAALPKLSYITTMSTGYDHIDLAAAKERGVAVSNVPAYGEHTVAEHTFALILGVTRKLFASVKRVKEGSYDCHGLSGIDLKEKTLGVIGTGRIGAHVIRIAKGFDMRVVAYDAFPNQKLSDTLGFSYVPLEALLKNSDIVTLHAPLLKSTYHLINKENISLMKPGSILINAARGALVDPEALLEALNFGLLSGAGLDVLVDEQMLLQSKNSPTSTDQKDTLRILQINKKIIDHPNATVTPHNAFNSIEALQRIIDVTTDNIKEFVSGNSQNIVTEN